MDDFYMWGQRKPDVMDTIDPAWGECEDPALPEGVTPEIAQEMLAYIKQRALNHSHTARAILAKITPPVDPLREAVDWLRSCSTWMLENDLDMQCPMKTDPLDLADKLEELRERGGGVVK